MERTVIQPEQHNNSLSIKLDWTDNFKINYWEKDLKVETYNHYKHFY